MRRPFVALMLVLLVVAVSTADLKARPIPQDRQSTVQVIGQSPTEEGATLVVRVQGVDGSGEQFPKLPCRVIMRDGDGNFLDGGGRGLYSDGRFFADGNFEVVSPSGSVSLEIEAGPDYVPLKQEIALPKNTKLEIQVTLFRWMNPQGEGWFGADNHVHAQHDRTADVKTSLAYAALQARANGLAFITEAGSNVDYGELQSLCDSQFQIQHAQEIRPGPFVGHFTTPGIRHPLAPERLAVVVNQPLPGQAIRELVEEAGGAIIHTHPLTPRHQLHWMGATEFLSDIVAQRTAHALDIDSRMADTLWFAGLNLGNRIAASSYTDCALGRKSTPSPGDRRVYVWLDPDERRNLDHQSLARALREGRSIATNGGPLLARWSNGGKSPAISLDQKLGAGAKLEIEIDHLYDLTHIEIYRRGRRVGAMRSETASGRSRLEYQIPEDLEWGDWFVLRVQDSKGNWSITSPVYVESPERLTRSESDVPTGHASALVFQISNSTRFIELRSHFTAHVVVTLDPRRKLKRVTLSCDGQVIKNMRADDGRRLASNRKLPVTEIDGEYETGWIWHPASDDASHFQADIVLDESGTYEVEYETADGSVGRSAGLRFDLSAKNSRQLSFAHVVGDDVNLRLFGYGEEMPLEEIELPFEGDHWWYPKNTGFWMQATLSDQSYAFPGAPDDRIRTHFAFEP